VLRDETVSFYFRERICLAFHGEEGKKEMAMAMAIAYRTAMFFPVGKMINYGSISTINYRKNDRKGEYIDYIQPINPSTSRGCKGKEKGGGDTVKTQEESYG